MTELAAYLRAAQIGRVPRIQLGRRWNRTCRGV